jgi:cell division protein FtsA
MAVTKGMRHGYIVDQNLASASIKKAVMEAEKNAGIKIKRALVSMGGVSLQGEYGTGYAVISKADGSVSNLDIKKAIDEGENTLTLINKKVLHIIPLLYKLDGKEILGKPEGMKGIKLEVKTIFITCLEQHYNAIAEAVSDAGVDVVDIIASPLASSIITLNDIQKTAGCVLVDIGGDTVTATIFENNTLSSLHVFPIGSADITKDIALAFKIPLEEAEGMKIGTILGNLTKKKLDDVIEARLIDMFELVDNYLKKIKRSGLLPAGAIIIGGGAHINSVQEIAKEILRLPSRIGSAEILTQTKNKIKDSSWFTVYGLCFRDDEHAYYSSGDESTGEFFSGIKKWFSNLIKQLLP